MKKYLKIIERCKKISRLLKTNFNRIISKKRLFLNSSLKISLYNY